MILQIVDRDIFSRLTEVDPLSRQIL
jgi:hypothetical protein